MKNIMIKLLLFAGSIALANGQRAEKSQASEKILVAANSEFALDLYAHLAKADENANLFFSPYSISNALLMVTEGARGETALEMGKVLGFPESLRRIGDDAQSIPWEMGKLRLGQSRLNELSGGKGASSPEQEELKKEETLLLEQWENLRVKIVESEEAEDLEGWLKTMKAEELLVNRLNKVRGKLDTLTLRIANAVWSDRSMEILEPWRKTVSDIYGTGVIQEADFLNQFEQERERINAWVEKKTEGQIKGLFPERSIKDSTRVVLANAIYFKGNWMEPFSEEDTNEEIFTLVSGEEVKVSLMRKNFDGSASYAAFNADGSLFKTPKMVPYKKSDRPQTYSDKNGFSMVEMPYQGGNVSMVVIAPNDPSGLGALENQISASNLDQWIKSLEHRKTHITLPKFKVNKSYRLDEVLSAMGMPTAFKRAKSDFSGISETEKIFIDVVFHKSFIEVNEKGTEAAAATGFGGAAGGLPKEIPFTPAFEANRPFIYLIRDRNSGAILFLGRVLNPNG